MRLKISFLAAACGLAMLGSEAQAAHVMFDGSFCKPVIADLTRVEHGPQYGVHNLSSIATTVQCPVVVNYLATVNNLYVTVYDRHTSQNVVCTLRGVNAGGVVIWQQTRSSSGWGSASQLLAFNPGASTQGLTMTCTLPANNAGNVSHVTTYRLVTTP